jgi:hypothetical protein
MSAPGMNLLRLANRNTADQGSIEEGGTYRKREP